MNARGSLSLDMAIASVMVLLTLFVTIYTATSLVSSLDSKAQLFEAFYRAYSQADYLSWKGWAFSDDKYFKPLELDESKLSSEPNQDLFSATSSVGQNQIFGSSSGVVCVSKPALLNDKIVLVTSCTTIGD